MINLKQRYKKNLKIDHKIEREREREREREKELFLGEKTRHRMEEIVINLE